MIRPLIQAQLCTVVLTFCWKGGSQTVPDRATTPSNCDFQPRNLLAYKPTMNKRFQNSGVNTYSVCTSGALKWDHFTTSFIRVNEILPCCLRYRWYFLDFFQCSVLQDWMNRGWMNEWWRSGDTIEESWGFTTSRVEMDHQGGAWNARNIMYVYWL